MKTISKAPVLAILALAVVGQLQAAPATQTTSRPNCFILSSGIDDYPGDKKLNGCLNDARNTVAAFRSQKGTMFANVSTRILLDGEATGNRITKEWSQFAKLGKAGDTMVFFYSGHGGIGDGGHYFCGALEQGVSDQDILGPADQMAARGLKVVIIIDACNSGQLRKNAEPLLQRHRDPKGGGIVLLLSSAADQSSAALGPYSAYAKAFVDSIDGHGDLNHDGKITLSELKSASFRRTHDLMRQHRNNGKQDAVIAWSASFSGGTTFAVTPPARVWAGHETLANYGSLSFRLFTGGRAQMTDKDGTAEGEWTQAANGVLSVRFGGVVYSGRIAGNVFSGAATNGGSRWSFSVAAR